MIQEMSGTTLAFFICLRLYESVMLCLILNSALEKRLNFRAHSLCAITALTALQLIKGLFPEPPLYASVIMNYVPDFLIAYLFYKGKLFRLAAYTAFFYATMFVGDAAGYIITIFFGAASFEPIESIENVPYITAFLSRAIMPLFNIALYRISKECRETIVRPSLILPLPLLICALLMAFFPVESRSLFNTAPMLFFAMFVLMLILLAAFIAALIWHRAKEKRLRDELERRAEQERYYGELFAENKRLESIFHDMASHMEYIANTGDTDYFETLKERIRGTLINTGNEIVNIILFGKSQKAVETGAALKVSGALPEAIPWIVPVDLHIVLANALDNAIEAVSRLEPEQREPIMIRFTCKGSILVIKIINRAGQDRRIGARPMPGRGYGLKNIRAVLAMYEGYMDTEAQDGYFVLSVMLQKPE